MRRYVGKTHKRREIRLAEHIKATEEGSRLHVHNWIRGLLKQGNKPTIFVLDRIPGTVGWTEAERRHIKYWKALPEDFLPMRYPPMTKKSAVVDIYGIALTNMTEGGKCCRPQNPSLECHQAHQATPSRRLGRAPRSDRSSASGGRARGGVWRTLSRQHPSC